VKGEQDGITVRPATSAELDAAEAVWLSSVTARDGHPPSPEVAEVVHDVMGANDTDLLVAARHDEILGMACTRPGRDDRGELVAGLCHIQMVFVRPEHWGKGMGGRLLDTVLDRARARGMTMTQLWVVEDNERATRLYSDRGFTHTGKVIEEGGALIGLWSRALT
jgi:GNAT superfamily N-acetyltransferase